MKKTFYNISCLFGTGLLLLILQYGCKEKYVPQLNSPTTGYLVVEGFINSGPGATVITLSRTTKLTDTISILKEIKATVRVEAKNSTASFLLTETSPGTYTYPQLTLNTSDEYRLRVQTLNGKQYVSDFSTVRSTVDIDSVSWREEKGGLQIYANAHDAAGKTKYYRYQYDETWEFRSAVVVYLKTYLRAGEPDHVGYIDSVNGRVDSSIYKCWKSFSSYDIMLTSTEKLSQDIVANYPLIFIEPHSWKLSVLYSVNLKQYAMSVDAYHFYEQLRKNTQQLGSIFDAQPSDNTGNMHPVNSTSGEVVVGFIEVTQEKQKRIYISNAQLPNWGYDSGCRESEKSIPNTPDSIKQYLGVTGRATRPDPLTNDLRRIFYMSIVCIDCTTLGVNKKPSFWPQ